MFLPILAIIVCVVYFLKSEADRGNIWGSCVFDDTGMEFCTQYSQSMSWEKYWSITYCLRLYDHHGRLKAPIVTNNKFGRDYKLWASEKLWQTSKKNMPGMPSSPRKKRCERQFRIGHGCKSDEVKEWNITKILNVYISLDWQSMKMQKFDTFCKPGMTWRPGRSCLSVAIVLPLVMDPVPKIFQWKRSIWK